MKKVFTLVSMVLAFGLMGCGDSNESKNESTKSENSQSVEQKNVETQNSTNTISQGALEVAQNYPFETYQNTTFKQMLEKWTNMCASVSWEVKSLSDDNNLYEEIYKPFLVTAYCEIKDFHTLKQRMQAYFANDGYVDFDFSFMGKENNRANGEPLYYGSISLSPLISKDVDKFLPGGRELLKELNDNQNKRIFDYVMNALHLPLSQVISQSEKIFLAFPQVVVYNDKEKKYEIDNEGVHNRTNVLGIVRHYSVEHKHYWDTITLSFQIQGNKFYVSNPYTRIDRTSDNKMRKAVDVVKAMFFNQNISPTALVEKNFILPKRSRDEDYGTLFNDVWLESFCPTGELIEVATKIADKKCSSLLAPPASKKVFYRAQEIAEYNKNLADFIIKVYSEPNVAPQSNDTSAQSTANSSRNSVAPSPAPNVASVSDKLPSIKLATKDDYVNLRKAPSGEILTPIYKKDFDKITIKKLDGGNDKWLKVLYFPPNETDESKAITGYIHNSQIAK